MSNDKMLTKIRGDRLRAAREACGFSIEEACAAFGSAYSTYKAHENGTTPFRLDAAVDYAKRYKVSLDWLVNGVGEGPKASGTVITPEMALRAAMLAYGVDKSQLALAVSIIDRFVQGAEGRPGQSQPDDQSQPASPRRESTPST